MGEDKRVGETEYCSEQCPLFFQIDENKKTCCYVVKRGEYSEIKPGMRCLNPNISHRNREVTRSSLESEGINPTIPRSEGGLPLVLILD